MSSSMPVNIAGGTITYDTSSLLKQVDNNYVSETGDKMRGNLNMGSHKLLGIPDPKNNDDAVNLKYVNKIKDDNEYKINNIITTTNEALKSLNDVSHDVKKLMSNSFVHKALNMRLGDYTTISQMDSLKFWASGHYPYGLHSSSGLFKDCSAYASSTASSNFSDSEKNPDKLNFRGNLKIKYNEFQSFYFDGNSRIVSEYFFKQNYTFFFLAKRSPISTEAGRLFTSSTQNSVLGWWSFYHECLWIGGELIKENYSIADDKIHLWCLSSKWETSGDLNKPTSLMRTYFNGTKLIHARYKSIELLLANPPHAMV